MSTGTSSSPLWPLAVGFVALAAGSFGVTRLVVAGDDASTATSVVSISTPDTPVEPDTSATGGSSVPTPTDPPATDPIDPLSELELLRASDFAEIETFVGFWVPQVSSKRPGIEADGIIYQLPDIVALHQQLRDRFGALLLFSADFNYQSTDLWVSIAPFPSIDPQGALDFCVGNGIDRENCFAKFITHDLSITDTVELQP